MHSTQSTSEQLEDYLTCDRIKYLEGNIATSPKLIYSQGMLANAYFFGHLVWAHRYFKQESNNKFWKARWQQVLPSWDGKVVVDIGCGPGNVYETLGGDPALLIGVDISIGALKMASSLGYIPLLADAQSLPLKSNFADVVTLNATIHHCDDMALVLKEAARLVRPGGILVTDLDPQISAWKLKGLGLCLNRARKHPLRNFLRLTKLRSCAEVEMRKATEIHNLNPGDGITQALYYEVLRPMGFQIELHPHNHNVGEEVFKGEVGKAPWYIRLSQWLSGIHLGQKETAQSIMCVALLKDALYQHQQDS